MMVTGTIILLLLGLVIVADAYGSDIKAHAMDWIVVIAKCVGSTLGSSVAIIFEPGGGTHKILSRFVIGVIMGVIFAPVFIDWMGWERSFDYWLASAAFCGMMGYLVTQIIYSPEIRALIKDKLNGTRLKP